MEKISPRLSLVEEEVVFAGVVGPDVFDRFVGLAFVFYLLQVLVQWFVSIE